MRTIKFKAVASGDLGTIVTGYYHYDDETKKHYITTETGLKRKEILPDTLGQFIGIKDKNNEDVYEGHLVLTTKNGKEFEGVIAYNHLHCCFGVFNDFGNYIKDLLCDQYDERGRTSKEWKNSGIEIKSFIYLSDGKK